MYIYIYAQCTYLYHVHTCRIRFDRMYNRIQGHTMRGHEPLVTWRRYIYGLDFKRRMRRNPLGSSAGPNHVHILHVPWSNMGIYGEQMVIYDKHPDKPTTIKIFHGITWVNCPLTDGHINSLGIFLNSQYEFPHGMTIAHHSTKK